MSKRNIFVFDIDDILHDLNHIICEEAKSHGFDYKVTDVFEWGYLVNLMGLDKFLEILHLIHQSDRHKIYEEAVATCKHLDQLGYELHYFTDRPEGYDKITHEWLIRHNFPQTENLHVCTDKREEIAKLPSERILALIDDRPRTMIWGLYELKVPHVFALRTAYNLNMSDIPNIHLANDWHELRGLLDQYCIMPQMHD